MPDAVLKLDPTLTDLLHDVLIGLTIEGRHTRQEDVGDDTSRPNVTLFIVVLVENFGSNIIRCSKFFVEISFRIIDERGTEINDLNLIEFLVLLEKNVFGLKITMDDIGLMAIVDAGKDLLHEDCTITLSEFATLENFIKKFATLADSTDILESYKPMCSKIIIYLYHIIPKVGILTLSRDSSAFHLQRTRTS